MTDEQTPSTDPVPAEAEDTSEREDQLAEEHAQTHPDATD